MAKRYLVGGPPNSGKSTYVLSLVSRLGTGLGKTAVAIELDVWSRSYPAFAGKVSFDDRPKRFGLDWDWQTPLDERLEEFNTSSAEIVLGDLPGAKIDAATDHMIANANADGAIVVSRTLDGLQLWREAFESRGMPVVLECLSVQGHAPLMLRDMDRKVDPAHPDVASFVDRLVDTDDIWEQEAAEERFASLFAMNYARRSRTVRGRDENLDGPAKKPLMTIGKRLTHLALKSCKELIKDVRATPKPTVWDPQVLRGHCERWFDIANRGICSIDWYEEEYRALKADADLIARVRGVPARVNERYRIWTPEHTLMKVPPLLLEEEMDRFYARLAELCAHAEKTFPSWSATIEALTYADLMVDGEIRPWLDGCGRVAVALVMWLARVLGAPFPLFATSKEVHKMTIRDINKHRLYFMESIRRAELEHP